MSSERSMVDLTDRPGIVYIDDILDLHAEHGDDITIRVTDAQRQYIYDQLLHQQRYDGMLQTTLSLQTGKFRSVKIEGP